MWPVAFDHKLAGFRSWSHEETTGTLEAQRGVKSHPRPRFRTAGEVYRGMDGTKPGVCTAGLRIIAIGRRRLFDPPKHPPCKSWCTGLKGLLSNADGKIPRSREANQVANANHDGCLFPLDRFQVRNYSPQIRRDKRAANRNIRPLNRR